MILIALSVRTKFVETLSYFFTRIDSVSVVSVEEEAIVWKPLGLDTSQNWQVSVHVFQDVHDKIVPPLFYTVSLWFPFRVD